MKPQSAEILISRRRFALLRHRQVKPEWGNPATRQHAFSVHSRREAIITLRVRHGTQRPLSGVVRDQNA
jgi:hypothetical protein